MKTLLIITAAIEAATGLALVSAPAMVATLLLGTWIAAPAAQIVARIAGAALLALSLGCWLARTGTSGMAARGLIAAMLLYNAATVVILAYAAFMLGLSGFVLWAAVVVHMALAIWCLACLRSVVSSAAETPRALESR